MKRIIIFQLVIILIAFNTSNCDGQAFTIGVGTTGANSPVPITVDGSATTGIYLGKGTGTTTGITARSTAVGIGALAANVGGHDNTAAGYFSLNANTGSSFNTAFGTYALRLLNSGGDNNTAVGYNSLAAVTSAQNNVALGGYALQSSTTSSSTAVGAYALASIGANGSSNSAHGYASLSSLTIGSGNAAFGVLSMRTWGTGDNNTAIGGNALYSAGTGNENTAVGYWSLNLLTSGNNNTVLGGYGLKLLTSGSGNVAIGHNALSNLTSGSNNIAIGTSAVVPGPVLSNQLSIQNVIYGANMGSATTANVGIGIVPSGTLARLEVGGKLRINDVPSSTAISTTKFLLRNSSTNIVEEALLPASATSNDWTITGNAGTSDLSNFIGTNDATPVAFNIRVGLNKRAGRIDYTYHTTYYGSLSGTSSLTSTTTDNTAFGYMALTANSSGIENTTVGSGSLMANLSGHGNCALGFNSLATNTNGNSNVGVGESALYHNQTASGNTAIGDAALKGSGTDMGNANTAVGQFALNANTGTSNTAVGKSSLASNNAGEGNTAVGYFSLLNNQSGNYNVALGYQADVATDGLTNATAIGLNAKVSTDYTIQLGASDNVDYIHQVTIGDAIVAGASSLSNLSTGTFEVRNSPQLYWVLTCTDASTGKAEWRQTNCDCVTPFVKQLEELQQQNELLKKEMNELKNMIKANQSSTIQGSIKLTETNSDAKLFQNTPNPFNKSTFIKYSIPVNAKKAVLTITSISGVRISEFDLTNKINQVEISGGQLAAGTYIYSLIIDDTFIDAKQMILTR